MQWNKQSMVDLVIVAKIDEKKNWLDIGEDYRFIPMWKIYLNEFHGQYEGY